MGQKTDVLQHESQPRDPEEALPIGNKALRLARGNPRPIRKTSDFKSRAKEI